MPKDNPLSTMMYRQEGKDGKGRNEKTGSEGTTWD